MEIKLKPDMERFGQPWPIALNTPVLFLIHASSALEERLVRAWLASTEPEDIPTFSILVLSGERDRIPDHDGLVVMLEESGATLVVPLHVAWRMPATENPRLSELFLGDPREPNRWKQSRLYTKKPHLIALVAAKSASIQELHARHQAHEEAASIEAFAGFVVRQAVLSLERAERGISGMRHKMPRFVRETISARRSFREAIREVSTQAGMPEALSNAERYLKEMVSVPRAFFVDLSARFFRYLYSRGYEEQLVYNRDDVENVRTLIEKHPVVFCFTHKSHVDAGALICLLHENGFPMLHTFGGINMAFIGMGSLLRRSGLIFIRRSFQDNRVYKICLKLYIAYLLEKHFPLAWAIEGTRSRTGKLMPPRLGILKYVVDAAQEVHSGNLHIVPVSIVYDLIPDVADYVAEQGGRKKTAESLSWFFSYVLGMRKPHGRISLQFGTAVEVENDKKRLSSGKKTLDLQKIAFEICVNANKVTPITSSSLIAMVLLGAAPQALTSTQMRIELHRLIAWARARNLPMSGDFDEPTEARFLNLVESMISMGIITRYDEGPDVIYMIARDQDLLVSYYRNTAIHFCFHSAIIELALLKAVDGELKAVDGELRAVDSELRAVDSELKAVDSQLKAVDSSADIFWAEAFRLRDLLKFEFFYSPKDEFRVELEVELGRLHPDWSLLLAGGSEDLNQILSCIRPFFAHSILRSFFEAYSIVADVLLRSEEGDTLDEKAFLVSCLKAGKQAFLQRRITSEESIGNNMFKNGLLLVKHLNLLEQQAERIVFARELKDVLHRIQRVQTIASAYDNLRQ